MGANSLEFAGGAVKLSNDVMLDIDGTGAVTIVALEGTSSETVTITTTATTTLGTVGTNTTTGIGDITVNGSTSANNGGIVLTGDITSFVSGGKTGGEQVQFTGAVVIKGDVTITTDASSGVNGTADDGKIHFSGANATILGHTSGTTALTLLWSRALELDGVIGGDSTKKLSKLHINATGGSAALSIPKIGTNATTAGTSGETIIGNTASGDITLSAATMHLEAILLSKLVATSYWPMMEKSQ